MSEELLMADQTDGVATSASDTSPILRITSLAARLFLGFIFLSSGAEKLVNLDAFAHSIANYELIPIAFINLAALFFVWTEIVIAIMLIAGAAVRGAAFVSGTLLTIFIIAIAIAMARGLEIDCGCFAPVEGQEPEKVGWPKLFEDVGLLVVALFLIYFPTSYFQLSNWLRSRVA